MRIEGDTLRLRVRDVGKITTVIPHATVLAPHDVAIPFDLDECHVLKNIGVKDVPSPIRQQYEWTGRYKPFAHQIATAEFLTLHKRALCLNEVGTGKTASCIWAADYLMNRGKVKRVLVICPKSIMDVAWRGDLFTFAMHRSCEIAYGTKEKRIAAINSEAEFVVINYEGAVACAMEIKKAGFDLVIVDEASFIKNATTARWKAVASIITPATWLWLLTGTPAAQSPLDAYGLAKLVNPKAVPRTMGSFKVEVMLQVGMHQWIPRHDAAEIVHRILQPAIRFTKAECLDLPPLTFTERTVEMTPQQKAYYNKVKQDSTFTAAGQEVTAVNAAVAMTKMLQIACGAVYSTEGEVLEFDISGRYAALSEVLEQAEHKVLVFVPYTSCIKVLVNKLNADGYKTEAIYGDVPSNKRTDIFQRFQNDPNDVRVLVIQPQAAAHGVTLTAANITVWWGAITSLETYHQANGRTHRPGQVNPTTVIRFIGSPLEKKLYKALDTKIDVHKNILAMYKEETLDN